MTEEWGPWIEHDGKGCPCVGQVVHNVKVDGSQKVTVAGAECIANGVDPNGPHSVWLWVGGIAWGKNVIRYRIRKSRGLTILEGLLENLPEKEGVE
jgi:hypothetical protein